MATIKSYGEAVNRLGDTVKRGAVLEAKNQLTAEQKKQLAKMRKELTKLTSPGGKKVNGIGDETAEVIIGLIAAFVVNETE